MKKNHGHQSISNTVTDGNKKPKKILVIDDDPGIQDIFRIILENAGYSIEIKDGGDDILKNKYTIPDLFLVDKQLSGYNGLELCQYLKKQKLTSNIPVIMVSASPDIGHLSEQAGADSYLEKPFEIRDLLKLVNEFVNGRDDDSNVTR